MQNQFFLKLSQCPQRIHGFLNLLISFYKACSHEKIVTFLLLISTVLLMNLQKFIDNYRSIIEVFVNTCVVFEFWLFLSRVMLWFACYVTNNRFLIHVAVAFLLDDHILICYCFRFEFSLHVPLWS